MIPVNPITVKMAVNLKATLNVFLNFFLFLLPLPTKRFLNFPNKDGAIFFLISRFLLFLFSLYSLLTAFFFLRLNLGKFKPSPFKRTAFFFRPIIKLCFLYFFLIGMDWYLALKQLWTDTRAKRSGVCYDISLNNKLRCGFVCHSALILHLFIIAIISTKYKIMTSFFCLKTTTVLDLNY